MTNNKENWQLFCNLINVYLIALQLLEKIMPCMAENLLRRYLFKHKKYPVHAQAATTTTAKSGRN